MGISINTNVAASRAGNYLATNHSNLQKSLDRLSSGKRITEPADDAGGLAVSMKLEHTSKVLRGTTHNISNAISFLQVQDGILESAGKIVSRMGELQGMSADVTKNSTDIDNYEAEFNDLRSQLYDMTKSKFNGVYLFGDWKDDGDGDLSTTNLDFADNDDDGRTHDDATLNVVIDEDSTEFTIHKALLGSALLVGIDGDESASLGAVAKESARLAIDYDTTAAPTGLIKRADTTATDEAILDSSSTDAFTTAAFTKALENIATLRATNGGQVRRLQYQLANVETQITNLSAANGRIMDVDIAAESSNLARQQVLVQASAAMTAQANMSNDVALMLLQ